MSTGIMKHWYRVVDNFIIEEFSHDSIDPPGYGLAEMDWHEVAEGETPPPLNAGYVDGEIFPRPRFATEFKPDEKRWIIDEENALKWVKEEKIAAIDAKTEELIKKGFSFAGKNFSMTEAAQRNWIALSSGLANGMLAFPLSISTVDEKSHALQDAGELKAFLGSYLMYQVDPRQPLGQGRVLKELVSAATTVGEVDAIVDDRE